MLMKLTPGDDLMKKNCKTFYYKDHRKNLSRVRHELPDNALEMKKKG